MTTPDHDESKPRRRWPTYLAIVLVLVFVVYPLSVGPVFVLMVRFGNDACGKLYTVFYAPLFICAESNAVIGDSINEYGRWWLDATNTQVG